MKKTVLFVTMLLAVSAQGQLVDSGFEDWTAGSPDGWYGARTNMTIPAEQVSDDVHGGASAVRLNRTESGHQRFTTQALSVTSGTEYEVTAKMFVDALEAALRLGTQASGARA